MVADGLPIHIGPYKCIKAAIFRLYFEELLGICDRILVMSGGILAGEVDARNTSQEEILTLAAKYV